MHVSITKAESRRQSETKILAAAEGIFSRVGLQGATIAEIAVAAGMPSANIHYYYKSKKALYKAVLQNVAYVWFSRLREIDASRTPTESLERYIRSMMKLSFDRPESFKLYTIEMLTGARYIQDVIDAKYGQLVKEKAAIISRWAEEGLMRPTNPSRLIFLIWGATEHYATFSPEIESITGRPVNDASEKTAATQFVVDFVLLGCGIRSYN